MNMTGKRAAREAVKWLGTPYRHQASLCQVGCDCLGLLRGVWRAVCATPLEPLPPYSRHIRPNAQERRLEEAANRYLIRLNGPVPTELLAPGTVLLFCMHGHSSPTHCAIGLGEGDMIHAQERRGVLRTPLSDRWRRRIHSLYLFPEKEHNMQASS